MTRRQQVTPLSFFRY